MRDEKTFPVNWKKTITFRYLKERYEDIDHCHSIEDSTEDSTKEGEELQPQETGNAEIAVESAAKLQSELIDYKAQIAAAETQLAVIKTEIESLNGTKTSITKIQQLTKLYTSMKPASAATILCELEETLSMQILTGMNERAAGKIMDAITTADPKYAAKMGKSMVMAETGTGTGTEIESSES